ncbi:hypothetical protein HaLaN_23326 [Haematococcus lacustris]|uniref:Uncharacterized protein n=1 Tax=Haematococcus lacustris TaxID=44745 RepID=A0A6A0A172_HAELA|nr:hypothetical protein HaLaN_23326 [Haematococcus lacustris]
MGPASANLLRSTHIHVTAGGSSVAIFLFTACLGVGSDGCQAGPAEQSTVAAGQQQSVQGPADSSAAAPCCLVSMGLLPG